MIGSQTQRTLPTILIVEDDEDTRSSEAEFLSQAGFKVVTAENGAEAARKASLQKFDAILCDIAMPRLSGDQFISNLKKNNRSDGINAETPVIVLSGALDRQVIDRLKGKIVKVFVKPANFDEIVAFLQETVAAQKK